MASWRDNYSARYLNDANSTTPEMLMTTIHTTKTNYRPLPGFENTAPDCQKRISMGVDCDEVFPNILIGDIGAAQNKKYLLNIGVTHVLNTAEGNKFGMVNTNRDFYSGTGIKYMGFPLMDSPVTNIAAHFQEAADFIENAVKSGGKILVHCLMGMSRSCTCVLAYLMIKERIPAAEALRMVRLSRDVRPNVGFLSQLAQLDNKLRRDRERAGSQHRHHSGHRSHERVPALSRHHHTRDGTGAEH